VRPKAKFANRLDARDFLIGSIISQSELEGTPLTEVEKKMLYFSESATSVPDMTQVSEQFDRDYDMEAYEAKIAGLVRDFLAQARKQAPDGLAAWHEAVRMLKDKDMYLMVMIGRTRYAADGTLSRALKLIAIAFGLACLGLLAFVAFANR
jgi:hypothetical protein